MQQRSSFTQTWIVVFRTSSGDVYGWVGEAESASKAEEGFRQVVTIPHTFITCVALLQSPVVDRLFIAYKEGL